MLMETKNISDEDTCFNFILGSKKSKPKFSETGFRSKI